MNVEVPLPGRPNEIHAGDFNGDGHIDLAIPSRLFVGQNQSLFFLAGHGDSSFEEPIRFDVGFDPFRAAVSRLNDDGLDDLALINCGSNDISILLGHPDQGFLPETRVAVGIFPIAIVAGDLNGDGIQELVVANSGTKDLFLLRREPGGFALSTTVALGGISGKPCCDP